MKPRRWAGSLVIASLGVLAFAANAQTQTPQNPPVTTGAGTTPSGIRAALSEADIKAFREGRRACNKMTGKDREECRMKLSSKYVDKQCGGLSDTKLDECLKGEYPGE